MPPADPDSPHDLGGWLVARRPREDARAPGTRHSGLESHAKDLDLDPKNNKKLMKGFKCVCV